MHSNVCFSSLTFNHSTQNQKHMRQSRLIYIDADTIFFSNTLREIIMWHDVFFCECIFVCIIFQWSVRAFATEMWSSDIFTESLVVVIRRIYSGRKKYLIVWRKKLVRSFFLKGRIVSVKKTEPTDPNTPFVPRFSNHTTERLWH